MKRVLSVFVTVCGVVALGGLTMQAQGPVTVVLKDAKGADVGTATITAASGGGVSIALDVKNLPAGEHALHIHQVALCEAPAFTSAGPHFNPSNKKHGSQNPEGPHNGDMANFTVKPDGTAKVTVTNTHVSLGTGADSLVANGTALMIHAAPDDMKTDPTGNAGARIACGVIKK
jgi:Cu-Zn family superoxide dismutase